MKTWLYVPFIILMAVTYTRVAQNFESEHRNNLNSRGPASVELEAESESECLDYPNKFNSHFHSENCL